MFWIKLNNSSAPPIARKQLASPKVAFFFCIAFVACNILSLKWTKTSMSFFPADRLHTLWRVYSKLVIRSLSAAQSNHIVMITRNSTRRSSNGKQSSVALRQIRRGPRESFVFILVFCASATSFRIAELTQLHFFQSLIDHRMASWS